MSRPYYLLYYYTRCYHLFVVGRLVHPPPQGDAVPHTKVAQVGVVLQLCGARYHHQRSGVGLQYLHYILDLFNHHY